MFYTEVSKVGFLTILNEIESKVFSFSIKTYRNAESNEAPKFMIDCFVILRANCRWNPFDGNDKLDEGASADATIVDKP